MASNEGEATAAATSSAISTEELRKLAVPSYRQPGVCRRKRIVYTETECDRAMQDLKKSMGEYRVLGFDVECINVNNPKQVHQSPQQPAGFRDMDNNVLDGFCPAIAGSSRFQSRRQLHDQNLTGNYVDGRVGQFPIKLTKYPLVSPILPNPQRTKRHQEVAVLIQLASWSGLVVMLRLCFWRSVPDTLREFLADPRCLKVGVGIDQDAARLLEDWGLVVRGWIDLRHLCVDMCMQFSDYHNIRHMGLKKLAEGLFGLSAISLTLPIGFKKIRAIAWSDWNAPRLREEQIRYAAWDAQIAVDIFALCTQRLYTLSSPQREDRSYFEILYEKCVHFVDIPSTRHPRHTGDDDDDYESDCDFYSTSVETNMAGDDEELRKLYNNYRTMAQQSGYRGFSSAATSSSPAEEKTTPSTTTGQVTNDLGKKEDAMAAVTLHSKPTKNDDRVYCSVSISSMNKKTGIAVVTLNSSPKNVLDFNTVKALVGYLHLLEDTKDCRAVIIASACSNTFSVGYDLKELRNADPKRLRTYWATMMELWFHLFKSRLTTVAAINGLAGGGGFMMAACCDRRVMASGCGGVGFTEVKLGISPPPWVIARVAQLVGENKAELILTRGHLVDAEHALEYGLVDRISAKDRLLDSAYDELEKVLDTPDHTRTSIKWVLRQRLLKKAAQERDHSLDMLTDCVITSQAQELIRRSCSQKQK